MTCNDCLVAALKSFMLILHRSLLEVHEALDRLVLSTATQQMFASKWAVASHGSCQKCYRQEFGN